MKRIILAVKESSRGVFWVIDGQLFAFPFTGEFSDGVAKSGNTYNHKKLWPHIKPNGCNKPYNYYPRGRVEFTNSGKFRIYMNPNIDESIVAQLKSEFGIRSECQILYDNSQHYKCYLDDGWKPDK